MNEKSQDLLGSFIPSAYAAIGRQSLARRRKAVTALLSSRRLPLTGWDDRSIEMLLLDLSCMDSNNSLSPIGVGEREARVYSSLVARRCYGLAHGVGRSGDISEPQPKAAGSSLMSKLCHVLVSDALRVAGLKSSRHCLILPMATGMSISLVLRALKKQAPSKTKVIWSRMDQKSALKAIDVAGLEPIVVPNRLENDAVRGDLHQLRMALAEHGESVLCVISTTSCFAPREPDRIDEIARMCKAMDVPHVVNNAYGLQCSKIVKLLERAVAVGRVDAIVQSTDKNFMVPVGGAIVCSPKQSVVDMVSQSYAGRGSSAPILDLFITLLSMGEEGYRELLFHREDLVPRFRKTLAACAAMHGESLLESPGNSISFAISLRGLDEIKAPSPFLGSMLYTRGISGTRVVPLGQCKTVAGIEFMGYGSSIDDYPCSYLTAACAIGTDEDETFEFVQMLDKVFRMMKSPPQGNKEIKENGESAPSQS